YPRDRAGWGRLCRLLTLGNGRAEKGDCILHLDDLLAHADGLELIVMERCMRDCDPALKKENSREAGSVCSLPPCGGGVGWGVNDTSGLGGHPPPRPSPARGEGVRGPWPDLLDLVCRLCDVASGRVRLAATMLYRGDDRARLRSRRELARSAGVPLIAVND